MSAEELDRLRQELETLRQENQALKSAVGQAAPTNGHVALVQPPAVPDPVFKGLYQQYQRLREANAQLGALRAQYDEAERALATLLPALELEIKGWTTEIENLQQSLAETEQAYAEVVARLESQIRDLRQDTETREAQLRASYEARLDALQDRLTRLESSPPPVGPSPAPRPEADEDDNPFTSFHIL